MAQNSDPAAHLLCDLGLNSVTVCKTIAVALVRDGEDGDESPSKGTAGLGRGSGAGKGEPGAAALMRNRGKYPRMAGRTVPFT